VTPNSAILFDEGGSRHRFRRYVYDHVFDDKTSQEGVYQKTTAALVKDVVNGFSAAVFAYGATGSGELVFHFSQLNALIEHKLRH
jgi:Kinesin motor domain